MINTKEKKKVGRMFRFLRFCAFLFVLFFTSNLMAAGYTCDTTETYISCVEGYYLEACGTDSSAWTGQTTNPVVGKTCLMCPVGYKCTGGKVCPVRAGIHCAAGEYIKAGTTTCAKCPAGKVCDAPTDTTDEVATSTDRGITGDCPANSYCPEGSASPTACPTGYGNSATGSDSQSDCYATCAIGTAVFSPGAACATGSDSAIGMSWFSAQAHNVYYGKISPISYCPYGSDMRGMVSSLHDSAADCLVTVPAGYSSEYVRPDAQYIRISSEQGSFPLAEIQVISDGVAQTLSPNSSMTSAGNAIDGNLGSAAFVGATSAQGYMAMFRTSAVVPISNILFALGAGVTRKIVIEISADATTWTTVFKGTVSGTTTAPAVLQNVSVMVRTNTQCAAGTYHGEVSVFVGTNVECTACPTVADHKMTSYDNLTHGAYVYPNENLVLGSAQQTDWATLVGGTTIESCRANYHYTNSRGYFIIEAVQYNTSTEKYDKNGSLYYTRPNAGYYLTTKYSDTYCSGAGRSMLYRNAQVCPAGSYCEGRTGATACSSGTYADNLGIDGLVSVGYYSTGGATTSTPKEGTGCVGGNGCGPLAAGYFSVQPGMKKQSPRYMSADCDLVTIDGVANSMGCGRVDAGYYSTGGGTHPRPTASGNGCIAGENCGKVAPGYYSTGGGKSSTGEGTVAAGCFSTGGATSYQPYSNEDCLAGETCGELEAGYFSTGGATKSNPTSADCVGYIGSDIWGSVDVPRKNVCGSILPGYYSTGGGVLPAPGNLDVTNSTALGFNVDLLNQGISTVRMGCRSQQECGMIAPGYWSAGAGTSSNGSGAVGLGYYSNGGGTSATPTGAGNGCLAGQECGKLAPGYYSRVSGMTTATPVHGTDCTGYYEEPGVSNSSFKACGMVVGGAYSTGGGSSAIGAGCAEGEECGSVAAGYYSNGGGTSATPTGVDNGCPRGQNCGKVAPGYYSTGAGMSAEGVCNTKLGFKCGTIDAGYWGEAGAVTSTGSGMVLAGFYSNGGGTSEIPYEAGNGCLDGQECGVIDAGYWNTGGGTSATPTTAGDGCVVESSNGCGKVSAGYWNTGCGANPEGEIGDACSSGYAGGIIEAGYWGEAGATTSTGSGMVDAGFYSTGGGTSAKGTCLKNKSCGQLLPGYWNDGCGINPKGGIASSCSSSKSGGIIDAGYWGGYGATTSKGSGKVSAGYWNNGCGTNPEGGTQSSCSQNQGGTIWPGYWGEAGATTPAGTGKVNAGYYNMGGGTSPTPVMRGSGCVNDSTTQCGTVAPGYWGEAGATIYGGSGAVAPGYFSTGGATSRTPSASDCVGKVAIIDSATGKLTGASDTDNTCGLVGAGYWNNGAGINAQGGASSGYEGGQVAAGYFSTGGATTAEPIDEIYCVGSDTECGTIDAGYWGEAGATTSTGSGKVYAGYWNNGCGTDPEGGIQSSCSQNQGGRIAAGYWGEAGATTPKGRGMVYAGYYSTGGATIPTGNGLVKAGYYNMGGGTSPTPVMRGSGCVNDSTTQCGTVAPGYWGEAGATIYGGSGAVAPGYFSTGGATSRTPSASDCVGKVAIIDSATGKLTGASDTDNTCGLVGAGYWNNGAGINAQGGASSGYEGGQVAAGYFSTGGATSVNPIDEMYCVGGEECGRIAPGYWGEAGATTSAGNGPVNAGYYSTGGATTPQGQGQVQLGLYSTCGATADIDRSSEKFLSCVEGCECGMVAAGYYATAGGTSAQGTCIAGNECGTIAPGYYSRGGSGFYQPYGHLCWGYNRYSDGINGCGQVDAGYYSTGGGTINTPTANGNGCVGSDTECGTIAAGYYGAAGATVETGSGTVDGGYYSTGGGTSATPTAAGDGCVANKLCGKLSAQYYSNGGSTSDGATCISGKTCGTCNANYRANTETGKTSASQCQASCAAGTRVATVNAACTSPAGGWFSAAHLVNYGQISPVNYCMSGYTSTGTSASGHDVATDCVQTIAGGKYVPSSKINARYIKITSDGSVSVSGSTNPSTHLLEMQAFASSDGTGTNLLSGKGAVAGDKMSAVTNGNWTRGDGYSYGEGSPMILDLGSVQALGSLKFAMYTDGREYQNVAIAVSEDNTTYTTVFTANKLLTQNTTTPTGELVVLSAAPKACALGTYKVSGSLALTNTSSCDAAQAGYFVGTTGASSQTKCVMGSYTDATGQSACKACAGGKTNSADGATSCTATCSNATGVASTGWETPVWNTDNTLTNLCSIKATAGCSANYYKNSNACSTCASGTNSKYTLSAAGTTTVNDCYLNTTATNYVANAGAGLVSCAADGYCPGSVKVYYGGTSSDTHPTTGGRTACVAPYGLAAAGSDDANDCYLKTTAGSYVESAGAGQKTCPAGSWCVGNVVIYMGGSVSGRATSGGSEQCPAGYRDGTTGYSLQSQCTMNVAGGKYVEVAKESSASGKCKQGYAKAAHPVTYGATSSCDACTDATYAAQEGMEKCEPCPTVSGASGYGYWNTSSEAGNHTVRAGCRASFKNASIADGNLTMYSCYVDASADTYGVKGDGKGCWVNKSDLTCNGGYYNKQFNDSTSATQDFTYKTSSDLLANVCRDVESGYWSGADSLTRTACATGLVTCGAGLCANEAGDCGRKLHAGDNVIYLRSEKRTGVSPLLHLKVGDKMFYGNMSTTLSGPLKAKYNNTKYSVVNDNQ